MPKIAAIETGAGVCLFQVRMQGRQSPCLDCLAARLREAGFEPRAPGWLDGAAALPPAVLESLEPRDLRCAPVVLLRGGQASVHVLLPVPNCPSCWRARSSSRQPRPFPEGMLRDPLLGLTSSLSVTDMRCDPRALCCSASGWVHVEADADATRASGAGSTAGRALTSHLGEAVERYCALRPELRRIVVARSRELPVPGPPLTLFNGLDPAQRAMTGYQQLRSDTVAGWIQGRRLADGAPRYVPAASVYLARSWRPGEKRFGMMISHGLAAHRSAGAARERALLELHERYHVTAAWHRRAFGTRVRPEVMSDAVLEVRARIARARLRLTLLALAVPPEIPVVMAILRGARSPWFMIGSAARRTVSEAAERALIEACAGWQYRSRVPEGAVSSRRLRPVSGAGDHHRYYADPRRAVALLARIDRGVEARGDVPRSASEADCEELVLRLAPESVEVAIETADVASCGFHVIRIVAPGLPLFQFGRAGTPRRDLRRAHLPDSPSPHPYV